MAVPGLTIYYAIHNTSAQNLSKINAMINPLVVESLSIGECPSNSPFLKNNGAEAQKGPRPIVFKEWRDTRTFSNLKSTHCTLLI